MNVTILKNQIEELYDIRITDEKIETNGFQNIVMSFILDGKRYIARCTSENHRTREQIEAELLWLTHLVKNGFLLANAVQINKNHLITETVVESKRYFIVIFEHTNGRPVNVSDKDEWSEPFFFEWGTCIGKLHSTQSGTLHRPNWLESYSPKNGHEKEMIDQLNTFDRTPETFGLIHNDLHQGNFHVKDKQIILFDFDDSAYHYFAQDLAVSIYHALWTGMSYHPDWDDFPHLFLRTFLQGYSSVKTLSLDMFEQIQLCMQFRERFLYRLFSKQWDPATMEEWQVMKIKELEDHIQEGQIPYIHELEKVKHLFE